jgi:hypothetical protein
MNDHTYIFNTDKHARREESSQHGPGLVSDTHDLAGRPLGLPRSHLASDAPRHPAVDAPA